MNSVPVTASGSKTGLEPQQGVPGDLENFEPQARGRALTWPLPRPDNKEAVVEGVESGTPPHHGNVNLPVKKTSSRRNPWGNQSYADLITQAISSAPDERLTLSQIYDWMMQNFSYFREKGESNSSAGWKNSIRHNLSLHNRFVRMQNEGTGKSSWWMVNRDAKPGKSSRRRAITMDTTNFTRKRTRVSKKTEALRNGGMQQADATPSPSNSVNEGLDLFPDSPLQPGRNFQLSSDFRPRASSNSSSCDPLSPIPAMPGKADWTPSYTPSYSPEQLAGNLAEMMKLESYQMYDTSPTGHQQQTGPPPSYYETQYQRGNSLSNDSSFALQPTPQSANHQRCMIHGLQPCACQMNLSPVAGMSPLYQQSEPSPTALGNSQQQTLQYMMQTQQCPQQQPQPQQQQQQQPQQQQQQQPQPQPQPQTGPTGSSSPQTPTPCGPPPSTMMGQLMGALNNSTILDDLNINIESLHDFDCNVEEVIKHELSMDGTLDFNFQQGVMSTAAIQVTDGNIGQNIVSQNNVGTAAGNAPAGVYVSTNAATPAAPPSWVH